MFRLFTKSKVILTIKEQKSRTVIVAVLTATSSFLALNWTPLVNIIWMNAAAIGLALHAHIWIFWIAIAEALIIISIIWKIFWTISGILLKLYNIKK